MRLVQVHVYRNTGVDTPIHSHNERRRNSEKQTTSLASHTFAFKGRVWHNINTALVLRCKKIAAQSDCKK